MTNDVEQQEQAHVNCWLDTELANTDKERSVVVAKGGAIIIIINFNSKLVQSKE
jgi:hypothetical protein